MWTSFSLLTVVAIGLSTVSARPQAPASQITDGQVQAATATVPGTNQISDGQVQASSTASPGTAGSSSAPSAKVLNGTYAGLHSSSYNEDFFLGIPYAQPPVNDLRFTVPQSLNSTFSEPRAADAYSPECVGYGVMTLPMPIMVFTLTCMHR